MKNSIPDSKERQELSDGLLGHLIRFCLQNKLIVFVVLFGLILSGLSTAPFDWKLPLLPRHPVAADAIPDLGENQQIIFTSYEGRSPQDVEDQVTYPLTVQLMGVPGVKTVRSYSYFGYSSIYVIFKEKVDFYWARSRLVEKLNSLPAGSLPTGVQPALGPDATGLGQVYWYTLEGRDETGAPAGGWDLDELKSINEFYVKYALQSVDGVAEVGSAGGMNREYQIDLDPDQMRYYGISLEKVYQAVSSANQEVGAKTLEINRVEYLIRAKGYVKSIDDLKATVVTERENQPIYLEQIAQIHLGPAPRRGALDKGGVDVAGGVVVARYGENPLEVIQRVEKKILDITPGLPTKKISDGRLSQVRVVPFYNRSGLIHETLATLQKALTEEVLVTVIVILFLLGHFRSGLVISILLPIAVLICFTLMKVFGIDANVVALSGIAIAIGTMVDMGIILSENLVVHLDRASAEDSKMKVIYTATLEVAGAIVTAVATTILSFLPVFTLTAAEGKLFQPLAFTKTFALIASLVLALTLIPPLALLFFRKGKKQISLIQRRRENWTLKGLLLLAVIYLAYHWQPLGPERGNFLNLIFVASLLFIVLWGVQRFINAYPRLLSFCLAHPKRFLLLPLLILIGGIGVWRSTGSEFMPSLDEGSFLLMPTTMPHASFEEAQKQLSLLDKLVENIPEVETVVGKMGRVESALDPAPLSMYEIVINYKSEYALDSNGHQMRQWREHIHSPDDIWREIRKATRLPGMTSAPKLMPIEARLIMLQSGMRAPMGIKIKGPDLASIEKLGLELESLLKEGEGIEPSTVIADRIVGKPYLEIDIDRAEAARYGLSIAAVQRALMTALGGRTATYTVEGRERYPVRLRYQRAERDEISDIGKVLISTARGSEIPLNKVAKVEFTRGPMVIKSEDGFLTSYVVFDRQSGFAETDVVEKNQMRLKDLVARGELKIPKGVSYHFTGNYENQVRARKTLSVILPAALLLIMLILYLQFKKISTVLIIYSGVFIAWAGGFLLIGLYNTESFLNFSLFGMHFRELLQIRGVNLSVAVWVGFIALSGIATDDGVLMSEYIGQRLHRDRPQNIADLKATLIDAGSQRIRPALMTISTTLLALLPVLTSQGRGADVMLPMSIPTFGGMLIVGVTVFVVPVLTFLVEKRRLSS